MRESSNPVLRSLPKQQGGYAQFGTGIAGATQVGYQAQPYTSAPPQAGVSGRLAIDDVVTRGVSADVAFGAYARARADVFRDHALLTHGLVLRPLATALRATIVSSSRRRTT